MTERALIVLFLRKHTNLEPLANLIEKGVHMFTDRDILTYCRKHGIALKVQQ